MRYFDASQYALRSWLLCCAYWLAAGIGPGTTAHGQLTVLSQGNRQAQWRQSQLAALNQQLSQPQVDPQLKLELQSQLKWLQAWQPGQLRAKPMWGGQAADDPWLEPELDPSGRAAELRERLLGESAKPTPADTRELQKLLADVDDDLGIRQLHLHWLDQPQYRKIYPHEIAEAAMKVLALLDEASVDSEQTRSQARAFTLYRRGRALAYRELPEVLAKQPLSAAELAKNQAALVGVYRQLKELVPMERPEFVLLDIRMLRQDNWNGRALALLEDYGSHLNQQWYLKKRRDILRDLSWEGPAEEAAEIYAEEFPEQVAQEAAGPVAE